MEDQILSLCSRLQNQNKENSDSVSKAARDIALLAIEQNVSILKKKSFTPLKRWIPPVRTAHKLFRMSYSILSFFCSLLILHIALLTYFGLVPHLTAYTCSSLVTHNYVEFDFISTPSLVKGVACLGLTYTTLQRNQGMVDGIGQFQNGTLSARGAFDAFYKDSWNTIQELYEGSRDISDLQIYKDVKLIVDYIQWIIESVWHTFTHSASDSTRTFVRWMNKKTQFIVTLRDAFIELPVIKQVREAVKAVEDTVEHHVVRPIRETVRHGVQCLIDGFSYFGKRLIQWGKTPEIKAETPVIDTSENMIAA